MLFVLSTALLALAVVGAVVLLVQWALVATRRPATQAPAAPGGPGVSILKPLCGVDDGLAQNLESYARLAADGRPCEVVLGVGDTQDAAWPLAQQLVARWPEVFRLVVQEGRPGLNPKVNQLLTLARAARHELLVISDSNVRATPDYAQAVVRGFEDPSVGCVVFPLAGTGERSLGALLDNLQMSVGPGAGMIAASRLSSRPVVVGKSMALRRADVEALGGFEAVKDVLAEDFVLGAWVRERLGKRVEVAPHPVASVSVDGTVRRFYERYCRWSVLQHCLLPLPVYWAQLFLNPVPVATLGFLLAPSLEAGAVLSGVVVTGVVAELGTVRSLRSQPLGARAVPAVLLKDAVVFAAWVHGLFHRTVNWRGKRLFVGPGTRLELGDVAEEPGASDTPPPVVLPGPQ